MSAATIRIDVRLFAGLREHAGTARTALTVPAGTTAGQARIALWETLGVGPPVPDTAMALAVNREYAPADAVLADGDELALIPPVSGGAGVAVHAAVTPEPLDAAALQARVARREAGGIVVFSGMARDVPQLDYEAHEQMAQERMSAILTEVAHQHGVSAIAAEHRVGPVPWPEPAIVVAVSAPHRGEAFAAAREALDRIKAEAPIWKQEVDGEARAWVAGTVPPVALPGGASGEEGERHPGGLLPHLRPDGGATMVDVGGKAITERRAVAAALLATTPETAALIAAGDLPKGDVLGVARIAGITAAKRVPDLVPLAHPLPLTKVDVRAEVVPDAGQVRITAEARTVGTTGVEIEAMTAALVAAINVYDMVKGVERGIAVGPVALVAKSGGRTGDFTGPAPWEPDFRAGDTAAEVAAAVVRPAVPAAAGSASGPARTASGLAHSASGSAQTASGPAHSASGSAHSASGSAHSASGSAQSASGSAQSASGSAQTASGSAQTASGSAQTASGSAHSASGSAQTASGPAGSASGSAQTASGLAQSASSSTHAASAPASLAHAVAGARDAPKPLDPPVRVGLLTVSTSRAGGPPDDPGTVALRELAAALGAEAIAEERVVDDRDAVADAIRRFADERGCDLVLTAGGTGLTVDDVTPEGTLAACDRLVPGIAEALRLESREHTHAWPLSRGVAAVRGRTLVVNLPGTPKAAAEARPVLEPILAHAVRLLRR